MAEMQFRISSGLKNIIGRDLITDDYVAVFELVKNAYDARASEVHIEFSEDKIVIEDNGKGMSEQDIREKWLHVAYSAKKEGTEDSDEKTETESPDYRDKIKLKRYYAGAKGIGRFSCDRLGNHLVMTTRKMDSPRSEQLKVNWKDFEQDANEDFVNIKVPHEALSSPQFFCGKHAHGTRLEITGIETVWDRKKKQGLKKSLEKLINPFESKAAEYLENARQTFSIFIHDAREQAADANEKLVREKVNGEVKNFVFEKLNLSTSHITVSFDADGKTYSTRLVDRGTEIYHIRKRNHTVPKLQDIRFHLFFLNHAAKSNFTRTVGVTPISFGSIFLYKNGFRIPPYGDEGDDSFGIDNRHAQGYARTFALRDVIGRIEIIGDDEYAPEKGLPRFKETSSRNGGLVKNAHFEALKAAFEDLCLAKLEKYVVGIIWKIEEDKYKENTNLLENLRSKTDILKLIQKEIKTDEGGELLGFDKNFLSIQSNSLGEAAREAIEILRFIAEKTGDSSFTDLTEQTPREVEKIKRERDELAQKLTVEIADKQRIAEKAQHIEKDLKTERQKNTYLLATRQTLSRDAEPLVHNIKLGTEKIRANVDELLDKIKQGKTSEADLLPPLGRIQSWSDKVLKISTLITRANFSEMGEVQIVDVAAFTEQYFSIFNDLFERSQMRFEVLPSQTHVERLTNILDLSVAYDNFVFNARKAGATIVRVECQKLSEKGMLVKISDNGRGVDKRFVDDPEKMFELGVTTTDGSGIGMFSIRENLRTMNATVRFAGNNLALAGATFEICFQ